MSLWLLVPSVRAQRGEDPFAQLDRTSLDAFRGVTLFVDANGERHARTHGTARAGTPVQMDTLFWVGSISKQFAAAAVLVLVDQGQLSLQDPVTEHFDALPRSALRFGEHRCTVEHLLSHTCGLPRDPRGRGDYFDALRRPERRRALLQAAADTELSHPPGSAFSYSNFGYDLVGLLVESASGQDYEAFLRRHLWTPAGMRSTGIRPSSVPDFAARIAHGHFDVPWLWLSAPRWLRLQPEWPSHVGASGNVYSTASDLLRWTRTLRDGSVLPAGAWETLTRPRQEDYALGWVVQQEPYGRIVWHNGALVPHGYNSFLGMAVTTGAVVVVLSNQTPPLAAATDLGRALLDVAHGEPVDAPLFELGPLARLGSGSLGLVFLLLPPLLLLSLLIAPLRRHRGDRLTHVTNQAGNGVLLVFLWTAMRDAAVGSWIALGIGVLTLLGALQVARQKPQRPLFERQRWLRTGSTVLVWLAVVPLLLLGMPRGPRWVVLATLIACLATLAWRPGAPRGASTTAPRPST